MALTLHRNGVADVGTNVSWRALDLADYGTPGEMLLRLGDSLLLTAGVGQTGTVEITVTDASGALFAEP